MSKLQYLVSVSKHLQNYVTKLVIVCGVFDYFTDSYPVSVAKRASSVDIVACLTFKAAVVNINLGNLVALSTEKRQQVSRFAVALTDSNVSNEDSLTISESALERQHRSSENRATSYSD